MIYIQHLLPLFLLLNLITSCQRAPPISGTIRNVADDQAYMLYLIEPTRWDAVGSSYMGQILDSVLIEGDGNFTFASLPVTRSPVLLELVLHPAGSAYPNQLDHKDPHTANYMPMVWDQEPLSLTASATGIQASIQLQDPDPVNAALLRLRDFRLQAYDTYLATREGESHTPDQLLEVEKALHDYQTVMMDFADTTAYLLPALTAIRWVSISGDYERVPEFLVRQHQRWARLEPTHPWVTQLGAISRPELLPVLVGDTVPNDPMPMLNGDTTALHLLLGSRLTLLDLWASWCAPCRVQNRNYLVPMWDKFHSEGFQIIGYALDGSRSAWIGAINKDGADRWLHSSHLQGDHAPLFQSLRLTTIPSNFLLDSDGKVLAKNLHSHELQSFVERFMAR